MIFWFVLCDLSIVASLVTIHNSCSSQKTVCIAFSTTTWNGPWIACATFLCWLSPRICKAFSLTAVSYSMCSIEMCPVCPGVCQTQGYGKHAFAYNIEIVCIYFSDRVWKLSSSNDGTLGWLLVLFASFIPFISDRWFYYASAASRSISRSRIRCQICLGPWEGSLLSYIFSSSSCLLDFSLEHASRRTFSIPAP